MIPPVKQGASPCPSKSSTTGTRMWKSIPAPTTFRSTPCTPAIPLPTSPPTRANPTHILITHAPGDHVEDALAIAKRTKAPSSAAAVARWPNIFEKKGAPHTMGMNHGGGLNFPFGRVTMTLAFHTSSFSDGTYGGQPGGFIIETGGKANHLLRRRHRPFRRHETLRRTLPHRPRLPPHRRHLHHGPRPRPQSGPVFENEKSPTHPLQHLAPHRPGRRQIRRPSPCRRHRRLRPQSRRDPSTYEPIYYSIFYFCHDGSSNRRNIRPYCTTR